MAVRPIQTGENSNLNSHHHRFAFSKICKKLFQPFWETKSHFFICSSILMTLFLSVPLSMHPWCCPSCLGNCGEKFALQVDKERQKQPFCSEQQPNSMQKVQQTAGAIQTTLKMGTKCIFIWLSCWSTFQRCFSPWSICFAFLDIPTSLCTVVFSKHWCKEVVLQCPLLQSAFSPQHTVTKREVKLAVWDQKRELIFFKVFEEKKVESLFFRCLQAV